jgi:hypothetical protein
MAGKKKQLIKKKNDKSDDKGKPVAWIVAICGLIAAIAALVSVIATLIMAFT